MRTRAWGCAATDGRRLDRVSARRGAGVRIRIRAVRLDLRGRRSIRQRPTRASAARSLPKRAGGFDGRAWRRCARWSVATTSRCWRSSARTASPAGHSLNWSAASTTTDGGAAWTNSPVRVERLDDAACWRVTLGGSKGNILDAALDGRADARVPRGGWRTDAACDLPRGRRARTSRSARACRSICRITWRRCSCGLASSSRPCSTATSRPGRRARTVSRRRPGTGDGLPSRLRLTGREVRPAGDCARRVRADRVGRPRRARRPGRGRRPVPERPQHRCRDGVPDGPRRRTGRRPERRRRSPTRGSTWCRNPPRACALRCAPRAGHARAPLRGAAGARTHVPRRPDGDTRRASKACGRSSRSGRRTGGTRDAHPAIWRRSSSAPTRCTATTGSRRSARGRRGPAAWRSATCRSTCRASCSTRRACCRSA